jgi:hypothetical protein
MKILRTILTVLAIVSVILQLLSFLFGRVNIPDTGIEHKIAYLVGRNFLLILAALLFIMVFFMGKHIQKKERKKMLDSFLK